MSDTNRVISNRTHDLYCHLYYPHSSKDLITTFGWESTFIPRAKIRLNNIVVSYDDWDWRSLSILRREYEEDTNNAV